MLRGKLGRSAFKFISFIVVKLHNFRFKTLNLQWRNNHKAHIFCLCGHSNSYHRWAMELHKVYMSDLCCGSCPNTSMPWSYAIHLVQKTLLAKQGIQNSAGQIYSPSITCTHMRHDNLYTHERQMYPFNIFSIDATLLANPNVRTWQLQRYGVSAWSSGVLHTSFWSILWCSQSGNHP
jgi:hypothetical protein